MIFKNSVRTSKRTPYFTITEINWLTLFKFNFYYFAGYDGQNHSQSGSAAAGDGTSSLDCLSLIVESISPSTAAVTGLLQGQGRPSARLHATSKHEDMGDNVDHTAPVVKMTQQ
jgi:hypothetical protein